MTKKTNRQRAAVAAKWKAFWKVLERHPARHPGRRDAHFWRKYRKALRKISEEQWAAAHESGWLFLGHGGYMRSVLNSSAG